MSQTRTAFLACLAAAGLLAFGPAVSAPAFHPLSGGSSGARPPGGSGQGGHRSSYSGTQGYGYRGHYGRAGHYGGYPYYGASYWGWGLGWGLALGVPWAWGWNGTWGPSYYPSYAYGPVAPDYAYACDPNEDCWRERVTQGESSPPTTQVPPAAAGEDGDPTQRPLHLNYCDSARAWFPQVRHCLSGWRFVRPEYSPAPP
ncbi:MAG: hypothetical protein IPP91_01765 [Betaproteobacteria bacterium]|nr:hypothetical protein [Betaproteobacteria bacterium]